MTEPDRGPALPARSVARSKIERRLAAIFAADVVGYSALMSQAEEETHRRVVAEIDRVFRDIERAHGRVFSFAGDGFMAEFASSVEALKCALKIQADSGRRNSRVPSQKWIRFRIGLNAGEIIFQRAQAGGNAVNVAARLETIAEPGGICLSAAVFEQVGRTVGAAYVPVGEQKLKNIRDSVMAYAIPASACSTWISMPAMARQTVQMPDAGTGEYRASLAVLPFRTLQKDRNDAYFAEGMIDDIVRALGGLKDLLVVSRSATTGFARQQLDLRRVGHELDVRYVLHGSVRRSGKMLRIGVELTEAPTGSVIWADRFDGELGDLFDLQDKIALRVATAIAPHLRDRELDRSLRKHPENMTAYDLTLQALHVSNRMDRASLRQALDLLEQSLLHDPRYAPAHSHIASLGMRWIGQGWSENEERDRARASEAAHKAIQHDPNDALGLAICGHLQSYLLRDYRAGLHYLERAIEAGPSCAWAWAYGGLTHGYLGDSATAVSQSERAVRLSPLGADTFWLEHYLSQAYYLAGRFEDSVAWARMSASRAGGNTSNLRCLTAGLVAVGDLVEARRIAQHLMQVAPTFRLSEFAARTPLLGVVRETFVDRLRAAGVPD